MFVFHTACEERGAWDTEEDEGRNERGEEEKEVREGSVMSQLLLAVYSSCCFLLLVRSCYVLYLLEVQRVTYTKRQNNGLYPVCQDPNLTALLCCTVVIF